MAALSAGRGIRPAAQLQPLVLPQLGQAWQEPARCIWTPHCMQYGASLWLALGEMAADGLAGAGSVTPARSRRLGSFGRVAQVDEQRAAGVEAGRVGGDLGALAGLGDRLLDARAAWAGCARRW